MNKCMVQKRGMEQALVACKTIKKGEVILPIKGIQTTVPTKYSVQVSSTAHIDIENIRRGSPTELWVFLNHSCQPNAIIKDRKLISITEIQEHDEITFNYNTTEYTLASPFTCYCGHPNCLKVIKGYQFLTLAQKRSIQPYTAPYLLAKDHLTTVK